MSRMAASTFVGLIDKMKSQDSDFRYMALNDLMAETRKGSFAQVDEATEARTVHQVLDLMKDTNGEVKNMAVKCLGLLVGRVRQRQLHSIFDSLIDSVSSKEEELRDLASLGLKTIMAEIPAESPLAVAVGSKLAPRLLAHINEPTKHPQEMLMEMLDVLADVFTRFSPVFASDPSFQAGALQALLGVLEHDRAAVRKRSMAAIGALAGFAASENFTQLCKAILSSLAAAKIEVKRTNMQLVGTLARLCPRRLGRRLPEFMPRVLEATNQEDDELRELALQAIEASLLRCPAEMTPFVTQAVDVAIELLKYDPNYAGNDDSDDEMFDGDVDDDLIDDDYSDEDDTSWKVRRASIKVLHATISTRPELLASLVSTVAPALVARFSEREDSVRLEILGTFVALLKQIQTYGEGPQATEIAGAGTGALKRKHASLETEGESQGSPRGQLQKLVPALAKALSKEMTSKAASSRLMSFTVLRELVIVLSGGLDSHLDSLLGQSIKSFKDVDSSGGAGTSVKGEILSFLRSVFQLHVARTYEEHLSSLTALLVDAIEDKAHRETLEGLAAASQLVRSLRPLPGEATGSPSAGNAKATHGRHIRALYEATTQRIRRQDSDQEIKERGVETLGTLISYAGDELDDSLGESLATLLERLRNEVTRFAAVQVVALVASSPICQGKDFDAFLHDSIGEVAQLLSKSNRTLKLAALNCLSALLTRSGSQVDEAAADNILRSVSAMLGKEAEDLSMLPLGLQLVNLLLKSHLDVLTQVQELILKRVKRLLESTVLQGASQEAVLAFLNAYVVAKPSLASDLVDSLARRQSKLQASGLDAQLGRNLARALGTIAHADSASEERISKEAANSLKAKPPASDAAVFSSLLVLAEVGRFRDLSSDESLIQSILDHFQAKSDDVKGAAAIALGNMAVGNLSTLLPVIEKSIATDDGHQALGLQALKELITHGSLEQLHTVADTIWTPLFTQSQQPGDATRNVAAECLARLTLAHPSKYLPQLQARLQDENGATRGAAVAAVRFALTTEASGAYDEQLSTIILDCGSLLQDPELDVRRNAVFALNSAAQNKPQLIREHLQLILPLLYAETKPRPELLRKIAMGPFTVTADDGLELRKTVFETMYTLLDTCFSRISIPEFFSSVLAGLSDEDGIKVISYLMLTRLASLAPIQLSQHLDELADPVTSTLKVKQKDNATKQEVERAAELQRAVLRALVALDRVPGAPHARRFQALAREARTQSPQAWKEAGAAQAGDI